MGAQTITRFYGFEPPKPFLTKLEKDIRVTQMNEDYLHEGSEDDGIYLPKGRYRFIQNNTLFLTYTPVRASSLGEHHYRSLIKYQGITVEDVLPALGTDDKAAETIKTSCITLVLSKKDKVTLETAKENPTTADYSVLGAMLLNSPTIFTIPELSSTDGLKLVMQEYYGKNFEVITNSVLLGKDRPYCVTATSLPDKAMYHKKLFVSDDMMCAALADHNYACLRYMLTGAAEEDKKKVNGETQCIAAMIQLMSKLGVEAVIQGKFFSYAIMYGCVRHTDDDLVRPYKLMHDFIRRIATVIRPEDWMLPGVYMQRVKNILENPHLSTFT